MTLTLVSRPSVPHGSKLAYSPSLGRIVVAGGSAGGGPVIAYSDDGVAWTTVPPLGVGFALNGIAWSESLGLFVASDFGNGVFTSPDGATWTYHAHVTPGSFFPGTLAWSEHQGIFVMVGTPYSSYYGYPPNHAVWTSTDGVTWTGQATDPTLDDVTSVVYSPALDRWAAITFNGAVWTSPDAVTWTHVASPLAIFGFSIDWFPVAGLFVAAGQTGGFLVYATSPDGTTWTNGTTVAFADGFSACESPDGSTWYLGGQNSLALHYVFQSTDHGATWTDVPTDRTGSGGEVTDLTVFPGAGANPDVVVAALLNGDAALPGVLSGILVPPPMPRSTRFFEGYPWRFIFTDIPAPDAVVPSPGGITTTWADGLITNRQISLVLNQPTQITADVWPDDKQVNAIFRDLNPLIAQSNRLVYAFRREGGTPPWVIRAAGILMSPEDQGDPDVPLTHFTAYDAWEYLRGRPCMKSDGTLPDANGFQFLGVSADQIVGTLLRTSILSQGFAFVDAGLAYGGTAYYGGTIETCASMNFQVQQGTMVGDAWDDLCNTGYLDIVLTPIYDPIRRPGYTHELNVYKLAGSELESVVFGWDRLNRCLTNIDRMHDGTPGNFVNIVQYYVGQGGPPVPLQTNGVSVDAFTAYWSSQFFPGQTIPSGQVVLTLAQQALTLGKQGRRTITMHPTPERSPVPLRDYGLGDRVNVYASKRLRVTSDGFQRVEAIPITISDDGIETVDALLVSPDWRVPILP